MKTFKHTLFILIIILSANSSWGQTLKVSDFRKAFNYDKPTDHKQLQSKGFKVVSDTILTNEKKYRFNNLNKKEIIELTFKEDGEGGEYLSIFYFLPDEITYKNFISTLTTYKFKYSKRNKRYQLPTSSYSGENLYSMGLVEINGKKYYLLKYDSYVDKALSGPRLGFGTNKMIITDTVK